MAGARFAPSNFRYNLQAACALVPSTLVAAAFGGKMVMGILAVGIMLAYTMDTLQYREGSLVATWGTLVLTNSALTFFLLSTIWERPVILTIGAQFTIGTLLAVVGMWATLQFKWIQARYPQVTIIFERHVLTTSLPLAAIMQTIGIASLVEPQYVAYYVAASLSGLNFLLARPLLSSFMQGGAVTMHNLDASVKHHPNGEDFVQSKLDGFLMSLLTCFLPSALYLSMKTSWHWHWLDFWSITLLWSVPLLFLCFTQNGLWWLPGPVSTREGIRITLLAISLCSCLIAFEGRVIFHSYGNYIKLHPPLSYLAVTTALLGFAALVVAHVSGALRNWLDPVFAGILLLLGTFTASLAAGIPLYWMPAPLLATASLILYLDTGSIREYVVFSGAAIATAIWFVVQHFWFLDLHLGDAGIQMQMLCRVVLVALAPALLIPGLLISRVSDSLVALLLFLQVIHSSTS